ncbi:13460_t:CDS:2, partial [Ambispora gerdemannii]
MDATDRAVIVRAILNNNSDNYLYDYLTRREEQSSFTEDCRLEHDGYLATLQKIVNHEANAKIAVVTDKFEVEKKSAAVSGFWKRIDEERKQREEEKAAVRTASLGHLNIIGRALTTYEPRIRRNLVTRDSDDVLGEQNNQEEVEVIRDVERESKTNGSLVSSVVMREVSSSFLPKQPRDEEAEVLSASVTKNIMSPPRPTYNVSRPSPVVRGKRKLRNLPEDRPHLRIRLHECESSDSEHEEDDDGEDFSSSSDDDGNDIGIDFDSNIFTENNEKGGWMLETGEKIVNVLSSMTSKAIEQVKHSEKRDACALSVIRLGLSSIIDLSSEFPGGMYEWFGEHWSALKARALEHLNITIRKFEDPLTTDIKKIMECCASYQYYEARKFVLGRMLDQPTECLYQQVMRCYFFVLDMFLRDPHVFVSKEGKKQNLSEMDYIVKIIGPILDIIFSDVQQLLQLK